MNTSQRRSAFLALSAELTGYSELDLEATGNVDAYHALVDEVKRRGKKIERLSLSGRRIGKAGFIRSH